MIPKVVIVKTKQVRRYRAWPFFFVQLELIDFPYIGVSTAVVWL
jgi:hypothetical protein